MFESISAFVESAQSLLGCHSVSRTELEKFWSDGGGMAESPWTGTMVLPAEGLSELHLQD